MPTYKELAQRTFDKNPEKTLEKKERMLVRTLGDIAQLRHKQLSGKSKDAPHAVFYASGFFQKGDIDGVDICKEDINGFMQTLHGVKEKSLTLILHTPGGDLAAVESIVEYLHAKYDYIEAIVPVYAMSGGAMISLASDHIIMGKAGQLGPLDPQLPMAEGHSTQVMRDAFFHAREQMGEDPGAEDFWMPLLRDLGALDFFDASRSLEHSRRLASGWLADERRHLLKNKKAKAVSEIADYFVAEEGSKHGRILVHDQRIGIEELYKMDLNVSPLEDDEDLQDAVMTAYWLMTLMFKTDPCLCKFIASNKNGICPTYSAIEEDVDEDE